MNAQSIQWRCRGCGISAAIDSAECPSCRTPRPSPDQRRLLLLASVVRPVVSADVEDAVEVPEVVRPGKKKECSLDRILGEKSIRTHRRSVRSDFALDEPDEPSASVNHRMAHAALSAFIGFFSGLCASISFCFLLGGVAKVTWIANHSWVSIFEIVMGIWTISGFIAGFSGYARPFIRLATPAWLSLILGIVGMFIGSIGSIGAPVTNLGSIGTGCFIGVVFGALVGLLRAKMGSDKDRRFVL